MPQIFDPQTFDLANRLQQEGGLRYKIERHLGRMTDLYASKLKPLEYAQVEQKLQYEVWRDCGFNCSLLMPHYFPRYPKLRPMSMFERPFNMMLMFLMPHHTFVLRGSRQIGKTVTLGTRQRTNAQILDGFYSMYVAPHSEPLNTYCRKFLDIERAFLIPPPSGDKYKQNLTYKEYPNGSKIEMVRVQTSATPVRGKSAAEILIDECFGADTYIEKPTGVAKVVDIRAGDIILAFDEQQRLTTDTVLATKCQGVRHTWKLHTASGRSLVCTENEKILSSGGWIYLREILPPTLYPGYQCSGYNSADAGDAAGDVVGGWVADTSPALQEPEIFSDPRPTAGGILPLQVRGNQTAGEHTAEAISEPRFRGHLGAIHHACEFGSELSDTAVLDPQPREARQVQEVRDAGVGGPADVGGGSLVVHGRRGAAVTTLRALDAQLQQGGGGPSGQLVYRAGNSGGVDADAEKGKVLLDHTHQDRNRGEICGQDSEVHASIDDVQVGAPPAKEVHVYILRDGFSGEAGSDVGRPPLLRGSGMHGQEPTESPETISRFSRDKGTLPPEPCPSGSRPGEKESSPGAEQRTSATALCRSGISEEMDGVEEGVPGREEGARAAREGEPTSDLQILRWILPEHGESQSAQDSLLSGVCGAARDGDEASAVGSCNRQEAGGEGPASREDQESDPASPEMILDRVTWIEYAGEQEVWDIETEKHHTFFANGLAVHNCQLFDPGLETEVLEVLNDSDIKSVMYAGTATHTETLLELRYQEGTQGVWNILLDNGQTINCGDAEQVMRYIGPYYMMDPDSGKQIDPLRGFYTYENPAAFESNMISMHIPQIINPDKANDALEWNGIYKTMIRDPKKFIQEKLGIPIAAASQEVSESDLKRICVLPDGPEARRAKCRAGYYRMIVSGFDWGGSDYNALTRTKISTTCHVMLGVSPDDKVHILHCKRHAGKAYKEIMNEIVMAHRSYSGGAMASDFGGGQQYHSLLRSHPYLDASRHVIFDYSSPESALCAPSKTSSLENMLMLNRTESITALYLAIIMDDPILLAPSWLEMEDYLRDFLNMNRVLIDKERGHKGRRFVYHRHPSKSDDVVHAMNMAFSLLRLSAQQLLIDDPAARMMIRNAVYGGNANTVKSMNPFARALSNYARDPENHD